MLVLFIFALVLGFSNTKPPSLVTIEGKTWAIVRKKEIRKGDEVFVGYTYCGSRTIELRTGQSFEDESETLLHEIMHAATCPPEGQLESWNDNNKYCGHDGIYWGAPVLRRIIRDNPSLVNYLRQDYMP